MRVEFLRIQGYRSLYHVSLKPANLTVLTGPNNSGKTNFVEAVDFLAEAYRHGLEIAVNRKGGIENIAHRRMRRTRAPLDFEVHVRLDESDMPYIWYGNADLPEVCITHRFSFSAVSQAIEADYQIQSEELVVRLAYTKSRSSPLFTISRQGSEPKVTLGPILKRNRQLNELVHPFDISSFPVERYLQADPSRLITEVTSFNPVINGLVRSFGATRLYQLVSLEGRRPGVPTPNAELDLHGGNLPALVAYMQKHHSDEWRAVFDIMQRIVPGLDEVRTEFTPDRRLALQFVERGIRRPWSSEDVSDGTIQSLALFTSLFDPRSDLSVIEEPENSLHPWIVRNFVDAARRTKKQMLLTTHSPALISYLYPEDLYVVWRRSGRTSLEALTTLDPDAKKLWESGDNSLFDIVDSGALVQAVPGEFE